jgi:hypothetical protein
MQKRLTYWRGVGSKEGGIVDGAENSGIGRALPHSGGGDWDRMVILVRIALMALYCTTVIV